MSPQPIRQSDWNAFLVEFTLAHEGWLASLSVQRGAERWSIAKDLPLDSVSLEIRPDGPAVLTRLSVVGPDAAQSPKIAYMAYRAKEILFRTSAEGFHAGLTIRAANDELAELSFLSPALPELLDGP